MKATLIAPSIISVVLFACSSPEKSGWQTTPSGLQYKIIHKNDSGRAAVMMATAKLTVNNYDNDSLISGEIKPMPVYQLVLPPAPYTSDPIAEVLVSGNAREGDSVITVGKNNRKFAFSIQKIYIPGRDGANTDSLIAVDKKAEFEKFSEAHAAISSERMAGWLKQKNIDASPSFSHTFTEIINPGTGPKAAPGKKAGIHFTIQQIYSGKIINSNTDTSFHQPPVLEYQVSKGFMLPCVDSAVQKLGKGGRAKIYIPAVIAAGNKAAIPGTDLEQDIMFDLEVVYVN